MKLTSKFQSGNVALVSTAHMLHDIYSSFLSPILPLLIEKLSLSYTQVSLLSVAQRMPTLINPVIGMLADRLKMRYLVIFTPAITCIIMSILGLANSYGVLVILLTLMGISSALFHVPSPVMIRKLSGKHIGKGMSYYMTGGELARTLGPLIIVAAVSLWGLEGTWRLIPFGLAASLILYLKLKNISISNDITQQKTGKGRTETIKELIPVIIALGLFVFLRSFMKQGLSVLLPTYMNQIRGVSFSNGGIIYALFQGAGVIGAFTSGRMADHFGSRRILLFISITTPVLMLIFTLTNGIISIFILIILGFLLIAQGPVLLAIINSLKSDHPAFINSIYMTVSFLVGALGMLLTGIISDWIGLEKTYLLSAGMALLAIPTVFNITRYSKKK